MSSPTPLPPADVFLLQRADTTEPVPLLICFSSVAATTFTFYRLTQDMPCDRLYIRDPRLKAWYQHGVVSPEGHLDDLLALIASVRRENQPVYCLGSSMGGYAAIYFGLKLKVSRVFALIPQITLWRRLPRSPECAAHLVVPTLEKMLAESYDTEVNIAFGENDMVDLYQMSLLPRHHPRLVCRSFEGEGHPLAASLNKNSLLKSLLHDLLSNRPLHFAGRKSRLLEDLPAYQIDTAHRVILLYYRRQYAEALAVMRECLEIHPDWALGYMWLAKTEEKSGVDAALVRTSMDKAITLEPDFPDYHFEAARMAFDRREYIEARRHLENLFKLSTDYKIGHQLLTSIEKAERLAAKALLPHDQA